MKFRLLAVLIIVLFIFLRFFELEERMQFTWDQVENSWMMKNMLIDGRLPLQGMVAKGNTGFYIGPAYYYLLAPFYKVFDLDPIAGAYFVGIVSLLTLIVLMYLTRKMFNRVTALFAGLLYTITYYIIGFDRIPWPVVFIPILSLIIFYCLWRFIEGVGRSLLFLAFFQGFAFHIHFTAIFFPMITFLVFLFIRWTKTKLFLLFPSFILFFMWFIPSIIASIQSGGQDINSFMSYISLYYHGLHGRRVLQVLPDIFIELKEIIAIRPVDVLVYGVIPLFSLLVYLNRKQVASMKKIMLVFLWFLIPLLVFSVYKGEISNYY
ncbi:MAG: glycosyltransferase family 39 protein, partial [Patescibacteria group bacterium]|nr:glycosyltransferase family 39 protein [Patescibacteria group bacterium]